jgi:hypothetical protein
MKKILITLVALSLLALGTAPARADITPFLNGISGSAGNWTWTYHSELSAAQELISTGAIPGAVSGLMGVPTTQYKDYFTIYDFAGFIPGSNTEPTNWVFQSMNVGSRPGSVLPTDNPNIPNLTWYYIGPKVTGPSEISNGLGLFTAKSIYGQSTEGAFAADATKHDPINLKIDGMVQQTVGSVTVPTVPEPSTFVLLGAGLIGAVAMRRRAKK